MSGPLGLPAPQSGGLPYVQFYDGNGFGSLFLNVITIPTATRTSGRLDVTGFRRWRFKWRIDDGGAGLAQTSVRIVEVSFNRGQAWILLNIGPFPFGVNGANVLNFGEGTGVLETLSGMWLIVGVTNLGPGNIFIRDAEFWCGG